MAISSRALDAALALAANPLLARTMRHQDLPPDIGAVLRALSGDASELTRLSGMAGLDERRLLDALESYVQQIMLCPGASARRILGVGPSASREEMRAHMRLLMIWLHPDRSKDDWRAAFSARVLAAWRDAQTPEGTGLAAASGGSRPAVAAPRRRRSISRPATQTWRQIPVSKPARGSLRRPVILGMGALACLVALILVLDAFHGAAQTARLVR